MSALWPTWYTFRCTGCFARRSPNRPRRLDARELTLKRRRALSEGRRGFAVKLRSMGTREMCGAASGARGSAAGAGAGGSALRAGTAAAGAGASALGEGDAAAGTGASELGECDCGAWASNTSRSASSSTTCSSSALMQSHGPHISIKTGVASEDQSVSS